MLRQATKRCPPLLTKLKTHRFTRNLQSSAESSKDFFSSSPSTISSRPSVPPIHRSHPTLSKITSFIKVSAFSAISAISATLATVGYATYAYTADEVDEKTKTFRSSINPPLRDTDATIENIPHLVYSAVMTAPMRAVNTYLDLRRSIEERVKEIREPVSDKLLPDLDEEYQRHGVMTLVLDLKETLIYNEWKREIGWRTYKRPGLDDFLLHMTQFYEIVIFTDEPMDDQIMSQKFKEKGVQHYLTRGHAKYVDGKHYRDLSKLNRDPSRIIYVSANAFDNCLQPENCVPIKPWKKEADDTTLIDLILFLGYVGYYKPEIRGTLARYKGKDIASEFIEISKRNRRRVPGNAYFRMPAEVNAASQLTFWH